MRRPTLIPVLIPLAAAGLLLSGCTSSTAAKRTTTVIATVTSGAAVSSSGSAAPTTGSGITVVAPSGTGTAAATSPAPSTSKAPATSSAPPKTTKPTPTTTPAPPINTKVDPLKADCSALLNAGDIEKVFGTAVPTAISRIRDVANPDRKITGKVRCLYGVKGADSKVVVGLTKYADPAAMKKQVDITREFETDKGAQASTVTVQGRPADVLLRDGGLILVPYGSWTLGIAVDNGVAKDNPPQRLQQAADMVLTRLLRTG